MQTLSFNVTHIERRQIVDAAREAVMTLSEAGCRVGLHNHKMVADGITNVHVKFDAKGAHGPVVIKAIQSIRRLPNVDAVKTL